MSRFPMPDPLAGGCACGAVRFAIGAPLEQLTYCHCRRCQHRSGAAAAPSARVEARAVTLLSGAESIRVWQPADGRLKAFCAICGGHLFGAALPGADGFLMVRMGALDEDPGLRPSARQWVGSAAAWESVPDDGVPRFDGPRPV